MGGAEEAAGDPAPLLLSGAQGRGRGQRRRRCRATCYLRCQSGHPGRPPGTPALTPVVASGRLFHSSSLWSLVCCGGSLRPHSSWALCGTPPGSGQRAPGPRGMRSGPKLAPPGPGSPSVQMPRPAAHLPRLELAGWVVHTGSLPPSTSSCVSGFGLSSVLVHLL